MAVKEELKDTVENLKQEVKELKEKLKEIVPFGKKNRQVPIKGKHLSVQEHPVMSLQRATNQLFDQFFDDFGWPTRGNNLFPGFPSAFTGSGLLNVDIKDNNDALEVTADLPGLDKEEIEVTLLGNRLTIKGEKKQEQEKKQAGYYRIERSYGSLQRSLWLPCEVDPDQVKASYKKGVLTVNLVKTEKAKALSFKIPVMSE